MPGPLTIYSEGAPRACGTGHSTARLLSMRSRIHASRLGNSGSWRLSDSSPGCPSRMSWPNIPRLAKAVTTTRNVRRAMVTFERLGYAAQKAAGHVVLSYETRAPFKLESGDKPSGQKRHQRTQASAHQRTQASAHQRTQASAPYMFKEREKEREAPAPPPCADDGHAAAPAKTSEPPPDSAPPPPIAPIGADALIRPCPRHRGRWPGGRADAALPGQPGRRGALRLKYWPSSGSR